MTPDIQQVNFPVLQQQGEGDPVRIIDAHGMHPRQGATQGMQTQRRMSGIGLQMTQHRGKPGLQFGMGGGEFPGAFFQTPG